MKVPSNRGKPQGISLKRFEATHKRKNIKELFAGYNGDYKTCKIDWGKKQGAEIW